VQNPYPIYPQLRDRAPVNWSPGYEQVREVYRSHDRFSNAGKAARNFYALPAEIRRECPSVELVETRPALSSADPPTHTRQRALVIRSLTPRRLRAKAERVEQIWPACGLDGQRARARPHPALLVPTRVSVDPRPVRGLARPRCDL
jgi:cytochrome P450